MKVLVLNSYAGSLTIAASNLRQEIIGSYEDANFGLGIQKLNFGWIDYREFISQWPKQDLSETFVVAHPPCSAFSTMTMGQKSKGSNSKAFSCTKKVMDYAMKNGAIGLAIESVMGALAGAWRVHQQAADENGYHIYRILQTGAMFSAQWRDRFWVVFIKKGAVANPTLELTLSPRWRSVRQVIAGTENEPTYDSLDRQLVALKAKFTKAGCDEQQLSYFFDAQDPPHPTVGVGNIFCERMFPKEDKWKTIQEHVASFSSGQMIYLDPNGLAPTLLGGSWWYLDGRNLSIAGYQRIAGFPDNYVFGSYQNAARMYMSKGVIPAVAEWVLSQAIGHLGETTPRIYVYRCGCAFRDVEMRSASCPTHDQPHVRPYRLTCEPDHIADFRFRKRDWREVENPPLRAEDEYYPTLDRVHDKVEKLQGMSEEDVCPIITPTSGPFTGSSESITPTATFSNPATVSPAQETSPVN